jgi:predicted transcriptional regulator
MYCAMSTITLRIPDDLKDDLDELCRQQNRPVSEAVRDAVRRYVVAERFHSLRRKTLPLAEAQGFLTDEDVFEATS